MTISAGVKAPMPWFVSARIDTFTVLIAGPLVSVMLMLAVMQGPAFLFGALLFALFLDLPHVLHTHVRLLANPADYRRNRAQFWGSLSVISLVCVGLGLAQQFAWLVAIWVYWQPYHVCKQHYGVATLYARKSGYQGDTNHVLYLMLSGFAAPLLYRMAGTSSTARTAVDFVKARFAAAGVQLRPEFADYPTTVKAVEGSNYQIVDLGGWVADYPDAENFYQLLYSKNAAPGPNHSAFVNAAYDRAYEASKLLPNGQQRYALFRTMNEIITDEVPLILGANALLFGMRQKWLGNFKRNQLTPEFKYLDIDVAAKKRGI